MRKWDGLDRLIDGDLPIAEVGSAIVLAARGAIVFELSECVDEKAAPSRIIAYFIEAICPGVKTVWDGEKVCISLLIVIT